MKMNIQSHSKKAKESRDSGSMSENMYPVQSLAKSYMHIRKKSGIKWPTQADKDFVHDEEVKNILMIMMVIFN